MKTPNKVSRRDFVITPFDADLKIAYDQVSRIISPKVFQFLVFNKKIIYHRDTTEDIVKIEQKLAVARGTQMELSCTMPIQRLRCNRCKREVKTCLVFPEIFIPKYILGCVKMLTILTK